MTGLRSVRLLEAALLVVAASASCSGAPDGVTVEEAWGRASPAVASATAFYMVITADDADRLVGAASSACRVAELHESSMSGEGVMSMRPVEAVDVPAGGTVSMEPGGLHVMCIDHTDDVLAGATVPLTLTFERSGDVAVEVEIRES